MDCPACPRGSSLATTTTEDGLRVRECPSCHGRWIRSDDYWRWRAHASDPWPASAPDPAAPPTEPEAEGFRFCPEDNYLLSRYEVGPPHGFSIDQCRTCSGVWLDAGEWEALLRGGLATKLRSILSQAWQDEIRTADRLNADRERWGRRLGSADLQRISEIKTWLDMHPRRGELYAFLRFHEGGR